MTPYRSDFAHLHIIPTYKGGDPAPKGYLEWHEWARVQLRAGLRQQECGKCCKWKFPQELTAEKIRVATKRSFAIRPVCFECFVSGESRSVLGLERNYAQMGEA
ncbi:hypothetical protein ASC90_22095 [Rhizobium sp. Root1220]|nr:hypothetical protein ASC90_22095 [Rhizobium sp. Root1220]